MQNRPRCVPAFILAATYVALVLLTAAFAVRTNDTAHDRIVGVAPLGMAFMMLYEKPVTILFGFLVTGTPWWYFIARIGCDSRKGKVGRATSALGLGLALLTSGTVVKLTGDSLRADTHGGVLSTLGLLQYCISAILCLSAVISAAFLFRGIFKGSDPRTKLT